MKWDVPEPRSTWELAVSSRVCGRGQGSVPQASGLNRAKVEAVAKPIIILRAGDVAPSVAAHRGEYSEWIVRTVGGVWRGAWAVHDIRTDEPLPPPREAAAFVMTGSSSSVTERAPWMLKAEAHVREIAQAETPLFGICFGHQLVAQALGGNVSKNPRGREIGTVRVKRTADDEIFEGVGEELAVNATHVDTVAKLPEGACVLASSELEPTQAFALGRAIRCVQFHPEIDGDAMRRYLDARADLITAEGGDAAAIRARSGDAPEAEETLRNFVRRFVRA
jgi:GMP synthase (glutamine-hydrolysing)